MSKLSKLNGEAEALLEWLDTSEYSFEAFEEKRAKLGRLAILALLGEEYEEELNSKVVRNAEDRLRNLKASATLLPNATNQRVKYLLTLPKDEAHRLSRKMHQEYTENGPVV